MKDDFLTHQQEKKQEEELKKYFELLTPEIPELLLRRMEKATFEKIQKRHRARYFMSLISSPWFTVPAAAAAVVLVVSIILLNSYDINDMKARGASFQVAVKSEDAAQNSTPLTSGNDDLNALKAVLSVQDESALAQMDQHLAAIIDKPVDKYWKDEFVHGWDWEPDGSYDDLAGEDWL